MSDDPQQAGPPKPPPQVGPRPMTATRQRLGTGRGGTGGPASPAEPTPPAGQEPSETAAQVPVAPVQAAESESPPPPTTPRPAAPPDQVSRSSAETPSVAAAEASGAAAQATPAERPLAPGQESGPPVAPAPPGASAGAAQPAAPAARPAGARPAAGTGAATGAGARPAPSAPAPTEPEADPEEVVGLRALLPDLQWKRVFGYVEMTVPVASLLGVARRLRDEFGYDYLSSVTAVDWPNRIEMVYHLYSFNYLQRPGGLVLRVDLERPELPEYPLCPSLTGLWPGADFQEREVYDLMGVKFIGHPDLRRILLADDFPGHPLRKDFVFDYEYVLVRHLSYGVEGQLPVEDRGGRSPY